jgi:hypothetical protein
MLADLHNLAAVRESHFASCGGCANGITGGADVVDGKWPKNGAAAFTPSPGNVITVKRKSGNRGEGWNASC